MSTDNSSEAQGAKSAFAARIAKATEAANARAEQAAPAGGRRSSMADRISKVAAAPAGPPLKRPAPKRRRRRFILDLDAAGYARLDALVDAVGEGSSRAEVIRGLVWLAERDPEVIARLRDVLDRP